MEKQGTYFEEVKAAVSRYSTTLIKIAFIYLKNMQDAEDVVQDVFVIYMTKKPQFVCEEHRKNWLMRCTINKCKDHLRSAWHRKREPISEEILRSGAVRYGSEMHETEHSEVMQAIWQLDVKYRIPFHLHYIEGYSIKEIAEMLNKKPSGVGTLLARARKKLERDLEERI